MPDALTWSLKCNRSFKYAHIKRDGHYTTFQRLEDIGPVVDARSSQNTDLSHKLSWHPAYNLVAKMPVGSCVAGELWCPGKPVSYIKTAINAKDPALRFDAFALLCYPAKIFADQPPLMSETLAALPLEDVERIVKAFKFDFIPYSKLPPTISNQQLEEDCRNEVQFAYPDIEGYVLKNGNLLDWYKLKPSKRIDLIVSGVVPGEGKYTDQIGSLIVRSVEGHELAAVGGMTDEQRTEFTRLNFNGALTGLLIEVEYQCVGENGRLRHPRFLRVREYSDKSRERCNLDQDPELVAYWRTNSLFGRCNQ